jgi:hypothetical protein
MRRSLLVLPFLALLGGCLHDNALEYDQLHISATRDGAAVTTLPSNGCVTLPLLLGSRVDETIIVATELEVDVSATRERVKVQFPGTGAASRSIDARELRSGYSDDVLVTSFNQHEFSVHLDSDCPTPDAASN